MAYAMGALTSKGPSEQVTRTGTVNARAEYALGQRNEIYTSGNLENDIRNFLNDPTKVQS